MVCQGWPLTEVAKHIQGIRHEYDDVDELSLVFILQQYRRGLPPADLAARTLPVLFQQAAAKVKDTLDVMDELARLYHIQMKRIKLDHATEVRVGKLFPTMTQEIREARGILEAIQKARLDAGLDERHLGVLQLEAGAADSAARYGKASVQRVLEDPASAQRILSLAERFVQISEKRSELAGGPGSDEDEDEGGGAGDTFEVTAEEGPDGDPV